MTRTTQSTSNVKEKEQKNDQTHPALGVIFTENEMQSLLGSDA